MADAFTYLEKCEAQLQYPGFQAAGWPIESGSVESGNKLVVEARLKGSGMHWARSHVDPMVALRNVVCNDRWDEGWAQIVHTQRQQATTTRIARRQKRHAARTAAAVTAELPPVSPPPETECPKIETPEPVAAVSVPTACAPRPSFLEVRMTRQPHSASLRAVTRPIPRLPPVIKTTF